MIKMKKLSKNQVKEITGSGRDMYEVRSVT